MQTQKIKLYQERDFGEKINATFTFLRENFVPLGKSLLYIAGPLVLLIGVVSALSTSSILFNNGELSEAEALSFAGGTTAISLMSIFSGALVIAVIYSYFTQYYEREDHSQISVGEVWQVAKSYVLPFLLSIIVYSILVMIGFFFLLIPGFILMAALSFLFVLQAKEKLSFGEAFSRCFRLVSDNYLSTIGLLLVVAILQGILGAIFGIPVMLISGLSAFFSSTGEYSMENSSAIVQAIFIVAQVISTLGNHFLYAILLVAVGFQYGNLVEQKESAGLMEEIDTLGGEKPQGSEEETF